MNNKIKAGSAAKDFTTTDILGKEINLKIFQGKKVLLSFFRYTECIFCNLHIKRLHDAFEKLELEDFQFVAIFQSPKEDILEYYKEQLPKAIIIADPERDLYKLYGVDERNVWGFFKGVLRMDKFISALSNGIGIKIGYGSLLLVPADFMIDELGVIQKAYYGSDITDHLGLEEIESFINKDNERI